VTFAFAGPDADTCGLARLGLSGGDGERAGSTLCILFAGGEPVATLAGGDVPVPADAGFERLALPGLEATVDEPLRRWRLRFGPEAGSGVELTFDAAGPPAELEGGDPVARAGGMVGYEQLCRVHGTVVVGGRAHEVRCPGQRGHWWGEPDWDRIGATRTLAAWLGDGTGLTLSAVRPAGAADHAAEAVWAALLGAAGSLRVDEPRLSTTYDEAGRQRRAALELWVGSDDAYPRRATGEVVCGTTLELGRLRLDCAFVRWRMDGRSGVGRYDVLRPA
jgi:hypothetical protein